MGRGEGDDEWERGDEERRGEMRTRRGRGDEERRWEMKTRRGRGNKSEKDREDEKKERIAPTLAVFTYCLLELHLVDLDATQFVFELLVEVECVRITDLFRLWDLQEDSSLPQRQGL